MRFSTFRGLTLAAVACVVFATGCCQKQEQEINALRHENEILKGDKAALETRVGAMDDANRKIRGEADQAQIQLADANQKIAERDQRIAKLEDRILSGEVSPPARTGPAAAGWELTAAGDKVSIGSDVLFSSGRASLTNAGKARLDRIAQDLKTSYSGLPVRVFGFTDSDPIRRTKNLWKDNLDLSANRAMAVTRYLIERGISADSIQTIAMGATNFVAANSSSAGKAKNRRVEIFVVRNR